MKVRIKSTGEVISVADFQARNPHTSFPRSVTAQSLAGFSGIDVVSEAAPPSGEPWQHPVEDGAEKVDGVWRTKYKLEPSFASQAEQDAYVANWTAQRHEALKASIVAAAQARLDDFAKTRGYDGILSASTYAASTNAQFAAEGTYAVAARDAMWGALYAMLAEVEAGTRDIPSAFSEIEGELPSLAWPE